MQQQQHHLLFEDEPERFQQFDPRVQSAALELMAALLVQFHRTTEQKDHEPHNKQDQT